jgi:GDP-4-dehydro-6-deoxy-D-mannose reductase
MRVLVTGARGFVGGHLVRCLAGRGAEVAELDREDGDVCDAASTARAVEAARPDAVVHLAGLASVARSFDRPVETYRANALGTVHVLEAVRAHAPGARVVVASSADVYGAARPEDLPLTESSPLAPASPYAASKAAAEYAALAYRRGFGLDAVVARSFNAVGPGQSTEFALPSFADQLAAIARGAAPPVLRVGNLEAERDLTDVRDVARAYALLVERADVEGVYNVCTGAAVSMRAALDLLVRAAGLDVAVEVDPSRLRPADAPRLVGSAERLERATGWRPEITLEQSLADLFAERAGRAESS